MIDPKRAQLDDQGTALRECREANERLAEANRELEAFSYSVSHDLRAPLRTIGAFTQVLAEDLRDRLDARSREHLDRVLAAVARMNERLDALHALAQIGRGPLGRQRVHLTSLAIAVLQDVKQRDPSRSVLGSVAAGLVAEADGPLVRILLENLVDHAFRLTANIATATIAIGAVHQDETVFFVRDNRASFDPSNADQLFGGSAIGLATARRIVERHGGRIWADGEIGRGATFYFTLSAG